MNIHQIYKQYAIPINLREHMYRTAAVGSVIADSLTAKPVSADNIIQTLLLHDMGNILKFDLSNASLLSDQDKARVNELERIQQDFTNKYGKTPDEATIAILEELFVTQEIVSLVKQAHWSKSPKLLNTYHWNAKIAIYADMRVGPFGVMSLSDRFDNLINRRPESKQEIANLKIYGKKLEQDIQKNCSYSLSAINDAKIEPIVTVLPQTQISVVR